MSIYSLYWIHHIDASDPFTEGYIGVTKNLDNRLEYNKNSKYTVGKAIRKYSKDIICDILYQNLDEQSAFNLEAKYRPSEKIGWNLAEGGFGAVGKLIPDENTKLKMSESHKKRYKQFGNSTKGKSRAPASPERIAKLKETLRQKYENGYINNRKGAIMSDEQKAKISASRKK
jgi:hypothetical protein